MPPAPTDLEQIRRELYRLRRDVAEVLALLRQPTVPDDATLEAQRRRMERNAHPCPTCGGPGFVVPEIGELATPCPACNEGAPA